MDEYQELHAAVKNLWASLTVTQENDEGTLIGLPNPYIVPSSHAVDGFVYKEQYYWDTYFIVRGLLADGETKLAVGMVDNLLLMLKKYGMVPNASRLYMLSRSQPPMLHMMVSLLVKSNLVDTEWLERAYKLLEVEYDTVWASEVHPHNRNVLKGLSRYYDINMLNSLAEAESGWDSTDRFGNECLDYTPIDLNCYLALFEQNMVEFAKIVGADTSKWMWASEDRKATIKEYMWEDNWFYDYNYKTGSISPVASLAATTALLVNDLLDSDECKAMVKKIEKDLEVSGGIKTSTSNPEAPYQWAGSNGWAPLHILTIDGLRMQGYKKAADRISRNWLNTVNNGFKASGEIYEKYNVSDIAGPVVEGLYPTQVGFAWTNASVSVFLEELS